MAAHMTKLLAGILLLGALAVGRRAAKEEAGDRGDTRQRLAPEAERGHRLEVVHGADLAGRVAGQRQRELVPLDAGQTMADLAVAIGGGVTVDE